MAEFFITLRNCTLRVYVFILLDIIVLSMALKKAHNFKLDFSGQKSYGKFFTKSILDYSFFQNRFPTFFKMQIT